MDNLRRIFYVSRADASTDSATVKDIVFRSQRNNRQKDVTGVLAHSGRHFAQVLEGTADNLAVLRDKIGLDKRHTDVTVLFDEPISKRDYAEWSMGFLYDAALSDEIEQALSDSRHQSDARDGTLARKIFLHVSDLARP
ncbi:MAG: BLUF domain-containing protein [Chitinophagaceae bacterium]|nr:MAG: BLUF domain-containing protein [Chitinophagaceae bacterium]